MMDHLEGIGVSVANRKQFKKHPAVKVRPVEINTDDSAQNAGQEKLELYTYTCIAPCASGFRFLNRSRHTTEANDERGSVFLGINDALAFAIGNVAPIWNVYSLACSDMLTLQTVEKQWELGVNIPWR